MLKVVGASWLQTRISTYILIAVALFGIGAIILSEFGHVEKDGTYSATVSWNRKGGYRIDFWGQGNELSSLPLNAARAYYKTGIFETGWSIIEIETSSKYPDTVQAYAAGLLEGSLTWQLIHHHWYNTVGATCEKKPAECRKLKHHLRENAALIRERAELLDSTDPFWHMVRLFYAQLDGLKAGWRFAVRRSRQSLELQNEDFLWLAMASDLPELQYHANDSDSQIREKGMILVKTLNVENSEPLTVIGHNTAASYTKMLRLLKKYTFNYHSLQTSKSSTRVPGRSVIMSSYPGALSSHDEFYMVIGKNRELVVAGTPLSTSNSNLWNIANLKDQVMSPIRVMASNRLATDSRSWSRTLAFKNSGTSIRQWISYEPRTANIWLIEQLPSITHAADFSEEYAELGVILCTGIPHFQEIKEVLEPSIDEALLTRWNEAMRLQENVTTIDRLGEFLRGNLPDESRPIATEDEQKGIDNLKENDPSQMLAYRGDLEERAPLPWGVIDSKILALDKNGLGPFQAVSGPSFSDFRAPFEWSKSFANITHLGQPNVFNFNGITPLWVWD